MSKRRLVVIGLGSIIIAATAVMFWLLLVSPYPGWEFSPPTDLPTPTPAPTGTLTFRVIPDPYGIFHLSLSPVRPIGSGQLLVTGPSEVTRGESDTMAMVISVGQEVTLFDIVRKAAPVGILSEQSAKVASGLPGTVRQEYREKDIEVWSTMRARLVGSAFSVQPEGWVESQISGDDEVRWSWSITADTGKLGPQVVITELQGLFPAGREYTIEFDIRIIAPSGSTLAAAETIGDPSGELFSDRALRYVRNTTRIVLLVAGTMSIVAGLPISLISLKRIRDSRLGKRLLGRASVLKLQSAPTADEEIYKILVPLLGSWSTSNLGVALMVIGIALILVSQNALA